MRLFKHILWRRITSCLLAVLCAVAAGLYSIYDSIVPNYISEAPTSIFALESLANLPASENDGADNIVLSDYSSGASSPGPVNLNDPYSDHQWALNQIQAAELWRIYNGQAGILVAILDTGIDSDHEDLAGVVIAEANFTDTPTVNDINGHGTHIAGIIAATRNNNKGIAGVAPGVRLLNVKVANDTGLCRDEDVARGIIWAVNKGAMVINISLELAEPSDALADAVEYAHDRGSLVIAAAGNNGSDIPVYPAGYKNTMAVAALTIDDCLGPLSNYGIWIDVAAPGVNIYSALPADHYGYKTGTSFATAHVSALAAVLFGIAGDSNDNGHVNDEVRYAIETGCATIGVAEVGAGRIDAAGSMAKIF